SLPIPPECPHSLPHRHQLTVRLSPSESEHEFYDPVAMSQPLVAASMQGRASRTAAPLRILSLASRSRICRWIAACRAVQTVRPHLWWPSESQWICPDRTPLRPPLVVRFDRSRRPRWTRPSALEPSEI